MTATLPIVASIVVHRRAWRELVSGYVFLSEAQRRIFAALDLPAQRTFVKANLVPRGASAGVPKEHLVAYLGRLDAAKGLPLLMAAWDHFESQPTQGLRLVIAGSGPLENQVSEWAASRPAVAVVGKPVLRTAPASSNGPGPSCCHHSGRRRSDWWRWRRWPLACRRLRPPTARFPSSSVLVASCSNLDAPTGRARHCKWSTQILPASRDRPDGADNLRRAFRPEVNLQQLLDIYRFAIEHPVVRAEGSTD